MERWSDDKMHLLRIYEGIWPAAAIAKLVGRSVRAVEGKLSRIKGKAHKHFERSQFGSGVSREARSGR